MTRMGRNLIIGICLWAVVVPCFGQARTSLGMHARQFMTFDPTHSFLVSQVTGRPVFIAGDAPQMLSIQLTNPADIETYLADRQAKGMTLIWVELVDYGNHGNGTTEDDAFGNNPWDGGADFTGMAKATRYWAHQDDVIQRAAAHGITVLANVDFNNAYSGCTEPFASSLLSSSPSTLYAYGKFLGSRYRDYPNVIWMMGGDSSAALCGARLVTQQGYIAKGILSEDHYHLICAEATNGASGNTWGLPIPDSTPNWSRLSWLSLGTIYTDGGNGAVSFSVQVAETLAQTSEMNSTRPFMPYFVIEDPYELNAIGANFTERQFRQAWYTEVLSGAMLGRLFGSRGIWPFGSPCCQARGVAWRADIDRQPSKEQAILGRLFRSREFWKLVPDQNHAVLTGGYGPAATLATCACTLDGETCIVYDPLGNRQDLQIEMSHFSGKVHGWWFNPSAATTTNLGTFSNSGTRTFTPPDGNDWVLVLDRASAHLPPPGARGLRA
jgi:hypothetical protein